MVNDGAWWWWMVMTGDEWWWMVDNDYCNGFDMIAHNWLIVVGLYNRQSWWLMIIDGI